MGQSKGYAVFVRFLRDNWFAAVFLAAIVISFVVSTHQTRMQDRAQAEQVIAGCLRQAERAVLLSAYQQQTANVRRAAGTSRDLAAAKEYQRFALGNLALIPIPGEVRDAMRKGRIDMPSSLFEAVEPAQNLAGDEIYALRPEAEEILHRGCREAYE